MNARATVQFAKHYVEMVAVMFAGMFVLGGALLGIAAVFGVTLSEIRSDAPAAELAAMGATMTAPMVWWMRRRGHSWAATSAMSMSMVLPTTTTILLLASGAVTDIGTLMGIEHIAMFPLMFVAMLPFRAEFTHPAATQAAAAPRSASRAACGEA
jgi:flagellar biosynthetic protein FliP